MRKSRVKQTLRGPSRDKTIDTSLCHQGSNEESLNQNHLAREHDLYHESLCSIPACDHIIDGCIPQLIVLTFFNDTNSEDQIEGEERTAGQEFERMCLDLGKAWRAYHGLPSSSEEFCPKYGRSSNEIIQTGPAPVVYYQPGQAQPGLYSPMSFSTESLGFPPVHPGFSPAPIIFGPMPSGYPAAPSNFPWGL
ncbi:hypothetical protein FHETE_10422 [Fusarium heterosporum]|uniref:Uncharacterized protein n=1 Tax=Fusarium heterosporum TaxID=42747 RepID=A0A8H5WCK1_FUSHE|nr:hypothetical protein FHETE_10422 [Fusarium heterosporum]